jgi:hypothetical protein
MKTNTFGQVKVGQLFTWQSSSYWMKKTSDASAVYADGSELPASARPNTFRTVGKVKWQAK